MNILIVQNQKELSEKAAQIVIDQIKVKKNSVFGLPTGNTPVGMYKNLGKAYKKGEVSFSDVITFNLDEYRWLEPKDKSSYNYYMHQRFFKYVDGKKENQFIFNSLAADPLVECANYEKEIKKRGGLDLTILGIGMDGHIAFNEPGSNFTSRSRVVSLMSETRKTQAKDFPDGRTVPRQAFTMGISTIMKSERIILLASGKQKADIVAKAFQGPIKKSIPASILQKHPNCLVILDTEAAKEIKG